MLKLKIYQVNYKSEWKYEPDTVVNEGYSYKPIHRIIITCFSEQNAIDAIKRMDSNAEKFDVKLLGDA